MLRLRLLLLVRRLLLRWVAPGWDLTTFPNIPMPIDLLELDPPDPEEATRTGDPEQNPVGLGDREIEDPAERVLDVVEEPRLLLEVPYLDGVLGGGVDDLALLAVGAPEEVVDWCGVLLAAGDLERG